jgi:HPt (histidine-containing phosphotransfer) domain-containing protein
MPGMDGLTTAKEIRKRTRNDKNPPVLVSFTAATQSNDLQKAYREAGISHALSKPFTEEELLKLLVDRLLPGFKGTNKTQDQTVPDSKREKSSSLDLDQLYRVAGGDKPFVKEMLEKFLESFELGFEKMHKAIQNEGFEDAGDAAHKLVSPCRHLGAETLVSQLKFIESRAGEKPDQKELEDAAKEVGGMYGEIKKRILDHLETMEG